MVSEGFLPNFNPPLFRSLPISKLGGRCQVQVPLWPPRQRCCASDKSAARPGPAATPARGLPDPCRPPTAFGFITGPTTLEFWYHADFILWLFRKFAMEKRIDLERRGKEPSKVRKDLETGPRSDFLGAKIHHQSFCNTWRKRESYSLPLTRVQLNTKLYAFAKIGLDLDERIWRLGRLTRARERNGLGCVARNRQIMLVKSRRSKWDFEKE